MRVLKVLSVLGVGVFLIPGALSPGRRMGVLKVLRVLDVGHLLGPKAPSRVAAPTWSRPAAGSRRSRTGGASWPNGAEQAEALGWTPEDLFGLHQPPDKPHPSYNRLSRYDELGLIWLLAGRPVIALMAAGAAIATPTGNTTTYYRRGVAPAADEHLAIPTFLQVANRKVPLDRQCPLGPAARATPSTIPNDQERTNARP